MEISQIIFIIAGIITIVLGISNIGINSRRMQRLIRFMGEFPTRILYVILGIGLIVMAFVVDLGTI